MQIHNAEFIKSHVSLETLKETEMPEFAFVGRSNVGKSSLINMLVGGKKEALQAILHTGTWYMYIRLYVTHPYISYIYTRYGINTFVSQYF